jgi:hypothetical protein
MLIGPLLRRAYSSPMRSLPHQELASVFNVATPLTWNAARICR